MLIKYRFWKIKKAFSPKANFKEALWKKLDSAWNAQHLPADPWYQTHWFRFSSALAGVVLVVSSVTTGAYAYVNPEVTSGTPLYVVKQALEKIEESFQITPQAQAKFYLKKVQRRDAEKIILQIKNKRLDKIDNQIDKLEKILEKASENLEAEGRVSKKLRLEINHRLKNIDRPPQSKLREDKQKLDRSTSTRGVKEFKDIKPSAKRLRLLGDAD